MIWVWIAIGILVVLAVIPFAVGPFLKTTYRGHASRIVDRSPEELWTVILDVESHPMSGPQCKSVELEDPSETTLPNWIENLGSTKLRVCTVETDPPRRIVRELSDLVVPMRARSVIEIEPAGEGSQVRVENETTIESGTWHVPVFRFIMTISNGARRACEQYLARL